MCNVVRLCKCITKNAYEGKESKLGEDNQKYGVHMFSKHKDLITTALEKMTKYDTDEPYLQFEAYKGRKVETEVTQVCFACRRLFNDTSVTNKRHGVHGGGPEFREDSSERKWELHLQRKTCTASSRMKAMHMFMVYESGSEVLRSKLTPEQKVGLIKTPEKRGRPLGSTKKKTEEPPITAIETIRIVELPADESEELKALKEQVKAMKTQIALLEVANAGYCKYAQTVKEEAEDNQEAELIDALATKAQEEKRESMYESLVKDGTIEDTEENREELDFL